MKEIIAALVGVMVGGLLSVIIKEFQQRRQINRLLDNLEKEMEFNLLFIQEQVTPQAGVFPMSSLALRLILQNTSVCQLMHSNVIQVLQVYESLFARLEYAWNQIGKFGSYGKPVPLALVENMWGACHVTVNFGLDKIREARQGRSNFSLVISSKKIEKKIKEIREDLLNPRYEYLLPLKEVIEFLIIFCENNTGHSKDVRIINNQD